jgi:hypothetical protein
MLLKIFQIIERQGMLPNTFHVVSITLISKTGQKQNRKETYKIITLMNKIQKPSIKYLQLNSTTF